MDSLMTIGTLSVEKTLLSGRSKPTILGTARVANLAARRGACADLNVCARHAGLALELELPGAPSAMDEVIQAMPKRTFQPNRLKRKRTHGFLKCVPASHGTVARRTAPT